MVELASLSNGTALRSARVLHVQGDAKNVIKRLLAAVRRSAAKSVGQQ